MLRLWNGLGGKIAVVSLGRVEARNALNCRLVEELESVFWSDSFSDEGTERDGVRVLVLRSDDEKVFCAGADLKERAKMGQDEVGVFVKRLRELTARLRSLSVPTIACLDGTALGGGLELALACDMRIASPNAIFGLPETSLAIIPGAGGTQLLREIVGTHLAKRLILTARKFNATDALKLGIVDAVTGINDADLLLSDAADKHIAINDDELEQLLPPNTPTTTLWPASILGFRLAKMLCMLNGPIAMTAAKKAILAGSDAVDFKSALKCEEQQYAKVLQTEDRVEALNAFMEKRFPVFKGR